MPSSSTTIIGQPGRVRSAIHSQRPRPHRRGDFKTELCAGSAVAENLLILANRANDHRLISPISAQRCRTAPTPSGSDDSARAPGVTRNARPAVMPSVTIVTEG
jgi:hypothetical protein